MSLSVTEHVWWASTQRRGARLVLLALAECADDDGVSSPSVPTLARMVRMTVRHCRRLLRVLEVSGEVTVLRTGGGEITSLYQVNMISMRPDPVPVGGMERRPA